MEDNIYTDNIPYQDRHVKFVTSTNGTSPSEILQILISISLTPILSSLLIPWIVPSSFAKLTLHEPKLQFFVRAVIEYPTVIMGPLVFITALTGNDEGTSLSFSISVFLICLILGIITINHAVTQPVWSGFRNLWESVKSKGVDWSSDFALVKSKMDNTVIGTKSNSDQRKGKYPFITNYRGIVTYVTVLSILAVDFQIFPRRFAKTKMFGFSLMDIGTGSFIFANGIVSPEAKNNIPNFKKSCISSIPLLILGFVRLITVKGMEYHEVVEEYGVHWNFFFTLALVKILSSWVFSVLKPEATLKIALISGILYELVLNTGLQNHYILNEAVGRHGLIDANREGLCSVWGYLTIYFASVYCGKLIYIESRKTVEKWCLYAFQSGGHILMLWIVFYVYHTNVNPCSRRCANLSYVLWAVTTNYTVLSLQLWLTLMQICLQHIGLLHGPLIFYELQAKKDRDEATKPEAETFSSKSNLEEKDDEPNSQEIDEALLNLENRLKKCEYEMTPENAEKFSKFMEEFDSELKDIDEKITNEEKQDAEAVPKTDLIPLPDLARSPVVLEAICYNGLAVFLLGNILTGLVNSLVYSMYVPEYIALFYMWIYASSIAASSLFLYWYNIQMKFW